MKLRDKLLLYFISLMAVTLCVFGFSAYQISYDSSIEYDKAILEATAKNKSNAIYRDYKTKKSLDHVIDHLLDLPSENHAWLLIDKNNEVMFPKQIKSLYSEDILLFPLKKMITGSVNNGTFKINTNTYLWVKTTIQESHYKLLHIYKPLTHLYEKRFSKLASRFFVTALIITWAAVWLALIISTTITKKVNYHKNAKQELNAANKILIEAKNISDKANKMKSEFLSNMSHELRTPLNAILGYGQLLEMKSENEESQNYTKEILKGGNHLLTLINEILDLSKIEAGHLDLYIEDCSLNTLLDECIALIKPLAIKHDISIINNISADVNYIIKVDYTRIKQALLNLLSNAVKYNRDEGSITINIENLPDQQLHISITDTGKGLYPDQINRLFNPFERIEAKNSNIEGTGIGLTITKRLIEAMEGSIGVTSLPGQGTTFWLEFRQYNDDTIIPLENDNLQTDSTQTDSTQTEKISTTLNKTILYIEDDSANLRLMDNIIKNVTTHSLISAPNASLGLKLIKTQKPDLILLDINLPDMDGYQVMALLQADDATKHIPVIALSANAMENDMLKSDNAGFQKYLTKPINVKKLLSSIKAIFEKN